MVEALKERYASNSAVVVTNDPVEVAAGATKPFDVTVNGTLVWGCLENVAAQTAMGGEGKPLLFANHGSFGDANPMWGEYFDGVIASA